MFVQTQKVKLMCKNRDWWGLWQIDVPAFGARLVFESMLLHILIFQKRNKKRKRRRKKRKKNN